MFFSKYDKASEFISVYHPLIPLGYYETATPFIYFETDELYYPCFTELCDLIPNSETNDEVEEDESLPPPFYSPEKEEKCVICCENKSDVFFCDCGYNPICDNCFCFVIDKCPVCRKIFYC